MHLENFSAIFLVCFSVNAFLLFSYVTLYYALMTILYHLSAHILLPSSPSFFTLPSIHLFFISDHMYLVSHIYLPSQPVHLSAADNSRSFLSRRNIPLCMVAVKCHVVMVTMQSLADALLTFTGLKSLP